MLLTGDETYVSTQSLYDDRYVCSTDMVANISRYSASWWRSHILFFIVLAEILLVVDDFRRYLLDFYKHPENKPDQIAHD